MTINCNGYLLDLDRPKVMGILNVNADSFYAESRVKNISEAISKTEIMLTEGANIIDLGAMSSRPGASVLTPDDEAKILLPMIEGLKKEFPTTIFSIDTIHSKVADQAIGRGVGMINDISGGNYDANMFTVLGNQKVAYVMMHMQGMPATMQLDPKYDNVVLDIMAFFVQKTKLATDSGITDILIDPGFGFGKSLADNYDLMRDLDSFTVFDRPILIGISRKSMIYKYLNIHQDEALSASSALHMVALGKGANILRVHDVKEAIQCIDLHGALTHPISDPKH